jgi:AcrR family transcriptional regulator
MTAGVRPRLNRARVLDAAVALADREGVEALTVRRLADDLGVHPTSLYNHVASKTAILDGVVERLLDEAGLPDEVGGWQEWVRALAVSLRSLARAHPGAFMVLTKRPAENPSGLRQSQLGLAAFRAAGFSTTEAVRAVRGVSLALLGLALNECPPMGDPVDPGAAEVPLADYPGLVEAAEAQEQDGPDAHWDLLVDAVVLGLETARRAAGR